MWPIRSILACTLIMATHAAYAAVVQFRADLTLSDPFGSLSAGTHLQATFAYNAVQTPQPISGLSNTVRYELDTLELSGPSGNLILAKIAGVSDGWIAVGDDSPAGSGTDFFSVRTEGTPSFSGTLGGLAVDSLVMRWTDSTGVASDGYRLPTTTADFPDFGSTMFSISAPFGSVNGSATGAIDAVAATPEPASGLLLPLSFIPLAMLVRQRHRAAS